MAVGSGNDCAVALAEAAGSESAFVDQMNQKAQSLGMADTHFVNCTGLPDLGHLTSAWDIALMSRELILPTRIFSNTRLSGPTPSETAPSASPTPTAWSASTTGPPA
ncbi:MAG: hypothetical protein V8S34_08675 [Lawsonibacter sp.]